MEDNHAHPPNGAPGHTDNASPAGFLIRRKPPRAPQQSLFPAQHPPNTQPSTDELTEQEKHALVKHWLARGKPILTLDHALWFNLEAILYSSDAFLTDKRREHAPELRQILAHWNNNAEVPNEITEVCPRQPAV